MAERIYLGALIDINKEQYLPIMKEQYSEINSFTLAGANITPYGADKIISASTAIIVIRDSYTLATLKQITIPKSPMTHIHFALHQEKIYCVRSDGTQRYLCIYDIASDSWTERLFIGAANVLGTRRIFIDGEYIYLHINQASSLTHYIVKCTLSDFTQVAISPNFSSVSAFDGQFFYGAIVTNYSSFLNKYDKDTLSVVATSGAMFSGNSTTISTPEDVVYAFGSVFVSDSRSTWTTSVITRVNAQTLEKEAHRTASAANQGSNERTPYRMFIGADKRFFGIAAGGGGTSPNELIEYDFNTLAPVFRYSVKDATNYTEVYANPTNGTVLYGWSSSVTQIERSYTLQSYKKLKEMVR